MTARVIIFLLVFIYACESGNKTLPKANFDNNLLVGEWMLDSSSNRHFSYDKLILLKEGNWFIFSGSDGGSLFLHGKWGNFGLITSPYNDTLKHNLLDSNLLHLSFWGNTDNFYKRKDRDYNANLTEYFQADSMRQKCIGWWKLISSKMPIKLPNSHKYCSSLTLNIRDDGELSFYLDNKLDSIIGYSYRANPDGIDIQSGCVISTCKITFDTEGRMKMLFGRFNDTLLLERLTELK